MVIILGADFGGLACAQALGGAPLDITAVDQRNQSIGVVNEAFETARDVT